MLNQQNKMLIRKVNFVLNQHKFVDFYITVQHPWAEAFPKTTGPQAPASEACCFRNTLALGHYPKQDTSKIPPRCLRFF